MTGAPAFITAVGLSCPVGLTWQSACAALRAGISRKSVSAYRDNQGREIVASALQSAGSLDASWEDRWLLFLTHALRDVFSAGEPRELARTQLVLTLPRTRSGDAYGVAWVCDALSAHLGLALSPSHVQLVGDGAAGSVLALQQACAQTRNGSTCIVAAADSLLSAHRLLPLAEQDRLLVEGNSDGIIPGEAAAALLLSSRPHRALAQISGIGVGQEPSRLDNDLPLRASGLLPAAQAALSQAAVEPHSLDFRLSDAAGESFYFKEQALLTTRLLRERKSEFPLWLPAESLGDTGAAAALCSLAWAIAAWQRGYAPGRRALCCAGNEHGLRTAVVLEALPGVHAHLDRPRSLGGLEPRNG